MSYFVRSGWIYTEYIVVLFMSILLHLSQLSKWMCRPLWYVFEVAGLSLRDGCGKDRHGVFAERHRRFLEVDILNRSIKFREITSTFAFPLNQRRREKETSDERKLVWRVNKAVRQGLGEKRVHASNRVWPFRSLPPGKPSLSLFFFTLSLFPHVQAFGSRADLQS